MDRNTPLSPEEAARRSIQIAPDTAASSDAAARRSAATSHVPGNVQQATNITPVNQREAYAQGPPGSAYIFSNLRPDISTIPANPRQTYAQAQPGSSYIFGNIQQETNSAPFSWAPASNNQASTSAPGGAGQNAPPANSQAASGITDQQVQQTAINLAQRLTATQPRFQELLLVTDFAIAFSFEGIALEQIKIELFKNGCGGLPTMFQDILTVRGVTSFVSTHFERCLQHHGVDLEAIISIALYSIAPDREKGNYEMVGRCRNQEQLDLAINLINGLYHKPSTCQRRAECELCLTPPKLGICFDESKWIEAQRRQRLPLQVKTFTFVDGPVRGYAERILRISEAEHNRYVSLTNAAAARASTLAARQQASTGGGQGAIIGAGPGGSAGVGRGAPTGAGRGDATGIRRGGSTGAGRGIPRGAGGAVGRGTGRGTSGGR